MILKAFEYLFLFRSYTSDISYDDIVKKLQKETRSGKYFHEGYYDHKRLKTYYIAHILGATFPIIEVNVYKVNSSSIVKCTMIKESLMILLMCLVVTIIALFIDGESMFSVLKFVIAEGVLIYFLSLLIIVEGSSIFKKRWEECIGKIT